MIRRLYIHNYRSFVNFEWQPPAACVLVGRNGSGKSSIGDVLLLLQRILIHGDRIEESEFQATRSVLLPLASQIFEIEIKAGEETLRYRAELSIKKGLVALEETLHSGHDLLYQSKDGSVALYGNKADSKPSASFGYDQRRSYLAGLEPRTGSQGILGFRQAIDALWILRPDPPRMTERTRKESPWLENDLSNFASWYRLKVLDDPEGAESMRESLRQRVAGFDRLRLERAGGLSAELRCSFQFGSQKHELSWAQLSDGQRLLIALYGVLHLAAPKARLLFLDEVENYLAPEEIQPWLAAVLECVQRNRAQLIVASHHPEPIDYLAADHAARIYRTEEGFSRIEALVVDREQGATAYDIAKFGRDPAP